MGCVPIEQLIESGKYVIKSNPWLKINPEKAKKTCILAKTPEWSRGRGYLNALPPQVKFEDYVAQYAMKQLSGVTVDARTDVIGLYMHYINEMVNAYVPEGKSPEQIKADLETMMRDALIRAINEYVGGNYATVDEAVNALRSLYPAKMRPASPEEIKRYEKIATIGKALKVTPKRRKVKLVRA